MAQHTSIVLDDDVKTELEKRRQYHGDLRRIVNTALRLYFQSTADIRKDLQRMRELQEGSIS